jgi:hypothetical protein
MDRSAILSFLLGRFLQKNGHAHSQDVFAAFHAAYPKQYAADLKRHCGSVEPYRDLHSQYGRQLAEVCRASGIPGVKARHRDLHGQNSWGKRYQLPPAAAKLVSSWG